MGFKVRTGVRAGAGTCMSASPLLALAFALALGQLCAGSEEAGGYGGCGDLATRTKVLDAECCDEQSEDCSTGHPSTCNAGCAAVLLPFFADCSHALGPAAKAFTDVVSLCHSTGEPPPLPGCNDDTAALVSMFGTGATCVNSRCAYVGEPMTCANTFVDDICDYLARVDRLSVCGCSCNQPPLPPPCFDFAYEPSVETGSCTTCREGGAPGDCTDAMCADGYRPGSFDGGKCQPAGGLDAQCQQPYTTLADAWRSTTSGYTDRSCPQFACDRDPDCTWNGEGCQYGSGSGIHGDHDYWTSGWYRFSTPSGDSSMLTLPLHPPGGVRSGVANTGWLSGCGENPPATCSAVGVLPDTADGVTEATACFNNGSAEPCGFHVQIGTVNCGTFYLWRLPPFPERWRIGGYCTTPHK